MHDSDELDDKETMAESQWTPFALAMEQSRKRYTATLYNSKCKPLQMINKWTSKRVQQRLILKESTFWVPYKSLKDTKSGPTVLRGLQKELQDVYLVIIGEFKYCEKFGFIKYRYSIIITHKLKLENLTTTLEKMRIFKHEDERAQGNVARTASNAKLTIQRMQEIALEHNGIIRPR
ncbi:hypothetical protein P3T76_004595 [Phytophthora citrophthora]|uniref:Uncharacterized protein n=1 Tax=Phytophthora citrophthora TaxID=4793 RepID=A0AAD9GQJ3_9STRA|nr:hypothetical protein P3T76_004595 [Phytophthora citrophthora]